MGTKPRRSLRSILIIVGGALIFATGIFAGSFLVLSSESSKGKSFYIKNISSEETSGLLSELLSLKRSGLLSDTPQGNKTEELLAILLGAAGTGEISPEDISDEFLENSILPLAEEERKKLLVEVTDSDIKIAETTDREAYLAFLAPRLNVMGEIFFELAETDVLTFTDAEVQQHFAGDSEILAAVLAQLREEPVPKSEVELHKKTVGLASALRKFTYGIASFNDDPLRAMVMTLSFEEMALLLDAIYNNVNGP